MSVGPYRILASLGAGGMGEVYRAEHVRLGREVALKVLHELRSGNPEYKSRFEREARVLASLNHPNIATLHGFEEVGDSTFLEMELVPGETLAERLAYGPLPPSETLPIFKQIGQALEAAHERGIIHRDLKPSNVKVTPEGRVKVLDFGLAKSYEAENRESSGNAAMFTTSTQPGVIMGTVAYMSPEHIRGKTLDRRTDIWAFGCMYYEAISGRPPFTAETVSDTLAAVLREEPDWRVLAHAPLAVQRLIKRCLKKDPTARLHDIADAGLEIDDAVAESAPLVVHVPGVEGWRVSRRRAAVTAGAVLATLAVLVALGFWVFSRMSPAWPETLSRVVVPVASGQQLERGGLAPLAISPDGTRLVYVAAQDEGRTQLFMRPLDQFGPTAIAGTDGGSTPFFSPDGQWIGFYANGTLQRVSVDGGRTLEICATPAVSSAMWGPDETIVFATPVGLWRVQATGSTPERLTSVDASTGEQQHAYPQRLPNGDVLFGVTTDRGWHLALLSLQSKQVRALGPPGSGGAGAQYVPQTGHLVYANAGGLVAAPFSPSSGSVPGAPVPLLERPEVDASGSTAFAISASGTLAYIPRLSAMPSRSLMLVDRSGRPTVLSEKPGPFAHPRLSPDGRRLAVAIESGNGSDIWLYDLDHGTPTPLLTGGVNRFPIWSADGQQVTFQSARLGRVSLYSQRVNGSFEPEALIRAASDQSQSLSRALSGLLPGTMPIFTNANPHLPMSWAHDGLTLAFEERKPGADHDIWVLTRGSEPWAFQRTENDESSPAFSPDGKWLAYVSNETGRRAVWVQPFPGPGARWLVSPEGGTEPAWSRDGGELYFRRANQLVAVAITPGAEFRWGRPQRVLEFRYATLDGARNYDVAPDGRSFVVVRNEGAADADQFNVVFNWPTELRSRR